MHLNGMEVGVASRENNTDSDVASSGHRSKPVVHPPADVPCCSSCFKKDLAFFDPKCADCIVLLNQPTTTITEMFAILRQWIPQTQQNLETIIRQMLKTDMNISDRDGLTDMTMLHYASKSGARGIGDAEQACQVIGLLLEHGADPYVRCRWTNMAAIHYATYFDVAPAVALLLQFTKAVDVDSPCSEFDSGTPLHIAARNLAYETAQVLLANGAFPHSKDIHGKMPIDLVPDPFSFEPDSESANLASNLRNLLETAEPSAYCIKPVNSDVLQQRNEEIMQMLYSIGVKLGDRVVVGGIKSGVLRFCGRTVFAAGLWAGIELDEAAGKNDGSVDGIPYFRCPPNYGIFAPLSKISRPGQQLGSMSSRGSLQKLNYGKVEVSHVTAKVDTGLRSSRSCLLPDDVHVGDHVLVAGKRTGVVHFIGETEFAPGVWYGIELNKPAGKNDGAVNGKRYFSCRPNHGVFAPPSRIQKLVDHSLSTASGEASVMSSSSTSLYRVDSSASQQNLHHSNKKILTRSKTLAGSHSSALPPVNVTGSGEMKLVEGMNVFCNGEMGTVRYVGPVEFADGTWLGVELKTARGKHDGSVQGRRYFICRPGHGLLVRPARVSVRGISGSHLRLD